ncbi:MAG: Fe-Mn family superoxide dismutase [Candidatus Pacebacteria bacterium]|nr:Fe-Mn family superoxide dismutase [Candidatus Paceibacterota bacterium]
MKFEEIKFNLGSFKGISSKNIEEHLKLYAGYVKNTNLIIEKLEEYEKISETRELAPEVVYLVGELHRRFGFEFNGMRNHEYYFKSLEGEAKPLPENFQLKITIEKQGQSFDLWLRDFKNLAMTRGVGWAVLYYDKQTKNLISAWVDEHHLGQLNGLQWILGIDMWEHAFVYDYPTSEKKKYVEAFFENLNWEVIEENFKKAQ